MSKKIVTGMVRFSYLNAFKPRLNTLSNKNEYSTQILIPKSDTATIAAIKAAVAEAIADKFGGKRPPGLRNPLKDGDAPVAEGMTALSKEYDDHYFISAKCSEDRPPQIVDADGQAILSAQEFGSGDYGRVSLTAYGYDQKVNKGVSFWLNNIQFLEKGEALDGRTTAAEDFAEPVRAAKTTARPTRQTPTPSGRPLRGKVAAPPPPVDDNDGDPGADEDWT